jgi:hypothetical protein
VPLTRCLAPQIEKPMACWPHACERPDIVAVRIQLLALQSATYYVAVGRRQLTSVCPITIKPRSGVRAPAGRPPCRASGNQRDVGMAAIRSPLPGQDGGNGPIAISRTRRSNMSPQTPPAELPVGHLGFGAMRINGQGIWGPPRDESKAIALLSPSQCHGRVASPDRRARWLIAAAMPPSVSI